MAGTIVTQQNGRLSLASRKLPIAFNSRDENAPNIFQENFRCHVWRGPDFHSQIDSITNPPFKYAQCHRARAHNQRAIGIS
jgi:hypothetical protein